VRLVEKGTLNFVAMACRGALVLPLDKYHNRLFVEWEHKRKYGLGCWVRTWKAAEMAEPTVCLGKTDYYELAYLGSTRAEF
jgi:hypothetical protein